MSSSYKLNRSILTNSLRTGKLDLHGLSLTSLPTEILSMPSLFECLTSLDLSQNRLTELPGAELLKFTSLKSLFLDSNALKSLPLELCQIKTLRVISLENNPLPAELIAAYQTSKNSGSQGREVQPLFRAMIRMEERDIEAEAEQLAFSASTPEVLATISPPIVNKPVNNNNSNGVANDLAARFKQASLSSHLFSPEKAGQVQPLSAAGSKKHSTRSHQPTHIFDAADTKSVVSSHKRLVHGSEHAVQAEAPYGHDLQIEESIKPRRVHDFSEKENEATSLPYFGAQDNRAAAGSRLGQAGKRILKTESSQAPFGTMEDGSDSTRFVSSSQHTAHQMDEAKRTLLEAALNVPSPRSAAAVIDAAPTRAAAGRTDTYESNMKGLLSQEASPTSSGASSPTHSQRGAIKGNQRGISSIFDQNEAEIFAKIHARSNQAKPAARSTSPWSTSPEKEAEIITRKPTSQVFEHSDVAFNMPRPGRKQIVQTRTNNIF